MNIFLTKVTALWAVSTQNPPAYNAHYYFLESLETSGICHRVTHGGQTTQYIHYEIL